MMLQLWLSLGFLMFFFLVMICVLIWWQNQQMKTLIKQTEVLSRNNLGTLEVLNKTITLLSVKDPLAYQSVAAMEIPSNLPSDDYFPQDDVSEYQRHQELSGQENDSNDEWAKYDPAVHGDLDFDLSTQH